MLTQRFAITCNEAMEKFGEFDLAFYFFAFHQVVFTLQTF